MRKVFEAESGLGSAYGRVLAAQRQGQRFLHLPRIIDCYSLGEQDAVVMEFVPGRTLADELYETGPSLDAAKRLFPGICDAIAELHGRFDPPIIHRDINKAGLVDILGASGAENVQGEVQQKLDLFANEKLKAALKARDIVAGICL